MQQTIVIHEVKWAKACGGNWALAGPLLSQLGSMPMMTDGPARIFSLSNYRFFRKSKLWVPAVQNGDESLTEFLIELPNRKLLLCVLQFAEEFPSTYLDNLRRPAKKPTLDNIENRGLSPLTNDRIYSIAVSTTSETLDEEGAEDGWLVVNSQDTHYVHWFGTYLFVALGVAIERALLNDAIRPNSILQIRWLLAPRKLSTLRSWPALPTIDSTKVARAYLQLRKSLHFTELRDAVVSDLEHESRLFGIFLSSFFAIVGIAFPLFASALHWFK